IAIANVVHIHRQTSLSTLLPPLPATAAALTRATTANPYRIESRLVSRRLFSRPLCTSFQDGTLRPSRAAAHCSASSARSDTTRSLLPPRLATASRCVSNSPRISSMAGRSSPAASQWATSSATILRSAGIVHPHDGVHGRPEVLPLVLPGLEAASALVGDAVVLAGRALGALHEIPLDHPRALRPRSEEPRVGREGTTQRSRHRS